MKSMSYIYNTKVNLNFVRFTKVCQRDRKNLYKNLVLQFGLLKNYLYTSSLWWQYSFPCFHRKMTKCIAKCVRTTKLRKARAGGGGSFRNFLRERIFRPERRKIAWVLATSLCLSNYEGNDLLRLPLSALFVWFDKGDLLRIGFIPDFYCTGKCFYWLQVFA